MPENDMMGSPEEFAKYESTRGKEDVADTSTAEADVKAAADAKAAEEAASKAKADAEAEAKKKDGERQDRLERPAKTEPTEAERALFKQTGELSKAIKEMQTALAELPSKLTPKQEAVDTALSDALAEIAKKRNLDAEGLKEIADALKKDILKNTGELPADVQEKLKLLDSLRADKEKRDGEQKVREDAIRFEGEWNTLTSQLKTLYPNATASELSEAKKQMDEISHTPDFAKYDLDYVLFKNRSTFDVLLKVARGSKSGEGASKQISEDEGDENEVDLNPDEMTPSKMAEYEKRRFNREVTAKK